VAAPPSTPVPPRPLVEPTREVASILARPPPPPPALVPRPYRASPLALLALIIGFAGLHIALDLFLRFSPGDLTGLPGARLLELFIFWGPILFLAAYLGLGSGAASPCRSGSPS
jgi:hypothetical protein